MFYFVVWLRNLPDYRRSKFGSKSGWWQKEISGFGLTIILCPLNCSALRGRYSLARNILIYRYVTVILAKGIILETSHDCPQLGGLAAMLHGTCVIDIHAPSGAEKNESVRSYNNDLSYLQPTAKPEMTQEGNVNCVHSNTDSTGQKNYSTALASIVHRPDLADVKRL